MLYFIDNIRNTFDFFLRKHITLSRKNYCESPQDLCNVFNNTELEPFYNALNNKYDAFLSQNTTRKNFLLNLYYLNVFDKYLSKKNRNSCAILDIGSKNWEYVKSEYVFFKDFNIEFTVNGIEIDAYRLCSNFYTRYEIAKFYTKDLPGTNYIAGDFIEHQHKYDYIIWILPFVTKYPLIKWGLPLKYFKPQKMLLHAYELLNPEGELLIINQGEEEYSVQQELIKTLLPNDYYVPIGEIKDDFGIFKSKRYCSKLIKKVSR